MERSRAGLTYSSDIELVEASPNRWRIPRRGQTNWRARAGTMSSKHYEPGHAITRCDGSHACRTGLQSRTGPSSNEHCVVNTLMVTSYAPYRDGIATYAVQEVRARRAAGEDISVLSPLPSAAHDHVALGSVSGMAGLLSHIASFDRLIIQFSPELIFGRTRVGAERLAIWGLLATVVARKPTDIRIHEIQYGPMTEHLSERTAARRVLRGAERVTVHTQAERTLLAEAAQMDVDEIHIIDHGLNFVPQSRLNQTQARAKLGVPQDETMFLSIGFVQHHKGFDRTVRSFGEAHLTPASAYVVGDVRVEDSTLDNHAEALAHLIDATPGAQFRRGYVGDAEFDEWITASDCVVLPYREIWSSSVVERAQLLGRPVIAAAVGGLKDQYPSGLTVVENDQQLTEAVTSFGLANGARVTNGARAKGKDQMSDETQPNELSIEQAQARIRSAAAKPSAVGELSSQMASVGSATEALDRVQPLAKPAASSHRPGIGQAKSVVNALTHFQIHPLVEHINRLHRATRAATRDLEDRVAALEARLDQSK